MKFLIIFFALLYFISPIDVAPGVPIDDVIVTIGSASYLLTPKDY